MATSTAATFSEAFSTFRGRLELDPSYDQIVQDRHKAIRTAVEAAIPGARTHLVGSLQRRTRIDPLSGLKGFDIDVLVELGTVSQFGPTGWHATDALAFLHRGVVSRDRYAQMDPRPDAPVVVVPYADGLTVELIPALRDGTRQYPRDAVRSWWVPTPEGWIEADYDYEAQAISGANTRSGGRLVPAIKMLRSWRRAHATRLKGFYLEVIAAQEVEAFVKECDQAGIQFRWIPLLARLFDRVAASLAVDNGVVLPGSYSTPIGNDLTFVDRLVSQLAARTAASAMRDADNAFDHERVIELFASTFGRPFPGAS